MTASGQYNSPAQALSHINWAEVQASNTQDYIDGTLAQNALLQAAVAMLNETEAAGCEFTVDEAWETLSSESSQIECLLDVAHQLGGIPATQFNWLMSNLEMGCALNAFLGEHGNAQLFVSDIINQMVTHDLTFLEAQIKVVIGGLHVSALPNEASAFADSVIQGEGELIWGTLLADYEKNALKPFYSSLSNRDFTFHFSAAKIPKYELLDISKYNRLTLQTTRGCPLNCSFCAASRTISAYKKKPIAQIEKELNKIFEVWDRPFIELADDNTFVDKKWSKELLHLFASYNVKWFTETDISVAYDDELLDLLAASNCAQVLIGFETSNPIGLKGIDRNDWKYRQYDNYLKAIDKIQSSGVSVNGCFILGFDTDTEATFQETEQFIKNSNLSEVQLTILTPFPGTGLYTTLRQENRLLAEKYWDKCTLFDVTFTPKNFSVETLESNFQTLMRNVYATEAVQVRKSKFKQTLKNKVKYTLA